MELFRVGGLSSEDLMRRDSKTPATQFLGVMFRMGAPRPEPDMVVPPTEDQTSGEGQEPPKQEVNKAAAVAPAVAEESAEKVDQTPHRWSNSQLLKMNKEKLTEVAAALGVVDLAQTNQKLIEAILERQ